MGGESSKQTGGRGFQFEDEVTAALCLYLLENEPPFSPDRIGQIRSIEFQAKDGSLFDDLIVTTVRNTIESRIVCSIKSFPVVNEAGIDHELVERMWQEFTGTSKSGFNKDVDYFALIGAPPTQKAQDAFIELLAEAQTVAPDLFESKLSNATKKKLYESIKCPPSVKQSNQKPGHILLRTLYQAYNFENPSSFSNQDVFKRCRSVLKNGTDDAPGNLFALLCRIATRYRTTGGSLTYSKLITEIGFDFDLRTSIRFERELEAIKRHTENRIQSIDSKIAGEVFLSRDNLIKELNSAVAKHSVIYIKGRSGSGKSALVTLLIKESTFPSVFLDAGTDCGQSVQTLLSLRHPFDEVINNVPHQHFIFVLDSLERNQRETDISFLKGQLKQLAEKCPNKMRIIITCEDEQFEQCRINYEQELLKYGAIKILEIPILDEVEMEEVITKLPTLRFLSLQKELHSFIKLPKILDLIGRSLKIKTSAQNEKWIGETNLINWIWKGLIEKGPKGPSRSVLVQKLAEQQADNLTTKIPEVMLDVSCGDALTELLVLRICRSENHQISFEHDLIGHWARYFIIQSCQDRINFLRKKSDSPLWYQAVRLFAQSLLEGKNEIDEWVTEYESFCLKASGAPEFEDAFLDALYFVPNSAQVLRQALTYLLKDNAKIFGKFLTRFLYKATVPDLAAQQTAKLLGEEDLIPIIEIHSRRPNWPLWLGMLQFLYEHRSLIPLSCAKDVALICELWLTDTSLGSMLRREAALIVFSLVKLIQRDTYEDKWRGSSEDCALGIYKALLLGATEFPDEVKAFGLHAAGRNVSDEEVKKQQEAIQKIKHTQFTLTRSEHFVIPWPDGPRKPIEEAFRKTCLETNALSPLMKLAPEVAREIILATILREPGNRPDRFERYKIDLEIEDGQFWQPPMFYKGPFLTFLRENSEQGIKLISNLISFATERWVDQRNSQHLNIEIIDSKSGKAKRWIGDADVYFWSREVAHVPNIVTSALMSLEAWLLELLRAGRVIDEEIAKIIEESDSLAIVGVLMSICKFKQSMIEGDLGDFLQIPYIYDWEHQQAYLPWEHSLWAWRTPDHGKFVFNMAKNWYTAPERRLNLSQVWLEKYVQDQSQNFSKKVEGAKSIWTEMLSNVEDEAERVLLKKLLFRFDRSNWQLVTLDDGASYFHLDLPPEIAKKQAEELALLQQEALLLTIPSRCQQALEEQNSYINTNPEEWSKKFEQIVNISKTPGVNSEAPDFQGPLTGISAVLLVTNYDWVIQQSEIFESCRSQILKSARHYLATPDQVSYDLEKILWSTGEFAAQGLTSLWVHNRNDRELREVFAGIFLKAEFGIVKILMKVVHRNRVNLETDYELLIDLGMRLAVQYDVLLTAKQKFYQDETKLKKCISSYHNWVELEIASFVDGKKGLPRPSILDQAVIRESQDRRKGRKVLKGKLNIDLETLMALYPNLASDDFSFEEMDETEIFEFIYDGLKAVCFILSPASTYYEDLDGTPNDFERWIFRASARFLVLTSPTNYDVLWKKVLDVGTFPNYWIDKFFHELIFSGLSLPDKKNFIVLWKRIIKGAFSNPQWSLDSDLNPSYRHLDDAWLYILGWDSMMLDVWNADTCELIEAMTDERKIWTSKFLDYPECLLNYVRFLACHGASTVRLDDLSVLYEYVEKVGNKVWTQNHKQLPDALAQLLVKCYSDNKADLKRNEKSYKSFRSLLSSLVQLQNKVAMNLQDKVISGL